MKLAENQQEMIEYISNFIVAKDNISVVVFENTLEEILEFLQEYTENEVYYFGKFMESDEDIYAINKLTDEDGNVVIIVKLLDDLIINEIIMIEEFTLEDIDVEIEADEIINVGIEENHPELEDEIYTCEECMIDNDYCDCENCHLEDEPIDEEEQELESFLEEFVEKVQETGGCPNCILEILKEVYCRGYVSGSEEEALNLYNALHERLYGEN